jgi:hypothetical protein
VRAGAAPEFVHRVGDGVVQALVTTFLVRSPALLDRVQAA